MVVTGDYHTKVDDPDDPLAQKVDKVVPVTVLPTFYIICIYILKIFKDGYLSNGLYETRQSLTDRYQIWWSTG